MLKTCSFALIALLMTVSAFAQEPATPKLSPELELKRQVLALTVQLKAERDKTAQLTVAYGQCSTEVNKSPSVDQLFSAFQSEVESANPDYTYDVEKGVFTPKPSTDPSLKPTVTVPAKK